MCIILVLVTQILSIFQVQLHGVVVVVVVVVVVTVVVPGYFLH